MLNDKSNGVGKIRYENPNYPRYERIERKSKESNLLETVNLLARLLYRSWSE